MIKIIIITNTFKGSTSSVADEGIGIKGIKGFSS